MPGNQIKNLPYAIKHLFKQAVVEAIRTPSGWNKNLNASR